MKTVIEMAHETLERMNADEHCREQYWSATDDELQAFAEHVRADAIATEREACAKVCDWYVDYSSNPMNFAENCAQEIRARGKKS